MECNREAVNDKTTLRSQVWEQCTHFAFTYTNRACLSDKHVEQLLGTFSKEIQSNHEKIPLYTEALAVINFPNCPQAGALMRPSAVNKAPRLEAAWIARYVYTYIHICTDEAT